MPTRNRALINHRKRIAVSAEINAFNRFYQDLIVSSFVSCGALVAAIIVLYMGSR